VKRVSIQLQAEQCTINFYEVSLSLMNFSLQIATLEVMSLPSLTYLGEYIYSQNPLIWTLILQIHHPTHYCL